MNAKRPVFLFLEITTQCNSRCRQCHIWKSREAPGTLSTLEKVGLVARYANWAGTGTIVLTGGETMAKPEEFFAVTRACRQSGLSSAANTNLTLASPWVDQILEEGPRYLVVSLDSHRAELHDWLRGRRGTHGQVVTTLQRLVRARAARRNCDVRILVNTILFDRNVPEVPALVTFLRALGIDGVMFQVLSRTFLLRSPRDAFFDAHFPRDLGAFDEAIDHLLEVRSMDGFVATDENDLRWMKLYARDPDFLGEQVCGSGSRNMMVDQNGETQLCFAMRGLIGGRSLGNVCEFDLEELWTGNLASEARQRMERCRRNCGMLNCHRKTEEA